MKPRTLFDKIWDYHLISTQEDGASLIYIDRHLVHEVTSPQAFEGLRMSGRVVNSPNRTLAVADHNVPTTDRAGGIQEEESKIQVEALDKNVEDFGIPYFNMMDKRQGIVHVIGPEQGFTQPGMTIVCGDSHTATHGAFGALAFGIGTSEVEHVLATQTLIQKPAKNMLINVEGGLQPGVSPKDLVLAIIGEIGTAGGTGHVIEYSGKAIELVTQRKGDLLIMEPKGDLQHLEFDIPSRGLIGLRNNILTATSGTAIMTHRFREFKKYKGNILTRTKGSLTSGEQGPATAFALNRLQDRGRFFVAPTEIIYKGQVVGEHNRDNDLEVNLIKGKQLTNMRKSGSDDAMKIAPKVELSLEEITIDNAPDTGPSSTISILLLLIVLIELPLESTAIKTP